MLSVYRLLKKIGKARPGLALARLERMAAEIERKVG